MLLRNPFINIFSSRHAKAQPGLGSLALTGGIGAGRNGAFQMSVALDEACSPAICCCWLDSFVFHCSKDISGLRLASTKDIRIWVKIWGPGDRRVCWFSLLTSNFRDTQLTYTYIVKVVQSARFSLSCLHQLEALGSMALHVCSWSQVGCTTCTSARESNKWNPKLTITLCSYASYALWCILYTSQFKSFPLNLQGGSQTIPFCARTW